VIHRKGCSILSLYKHSFINNVPLFLITVDKKRHRKIKKIDKTYAEDQVPQPSDDLITLTNNELYQSPISVMLDDNRVRKN